MSTAQTPQLLSVVTIVFDDAERLGRAVASVTSQQLPDGWELEVLVVDDASTDGSAQVADAIAAQDPRVRVIHRETNSGGCGAPRNDGTAAARGRYVAYLDSDDEYLPGALARLVETAERDAADVVTGPAARFSTRLGERTEPFNESFYATVGVFTPFVDRDDVFSDTIAPAKLFRRAFLTEHDLSFPADIAYEDLLFTARVWLAAPRLSVVGEPVYLWYISNDPDNPSITSSRHKLSNLTDRLESHRRIDRLVRRRADGTRLAELKLEKLARHDLGLYARPLPDRDATYQAAFLEHVGTYLRNVPNDVRATLKQPYRLMVRTIVDGDLASVLAASRFVYRRGQLVVPLATVDGGPAWPLVHGKPEHRDYRLTAYCATLARRGRLHPLSITVESLSADGGRLDVRGTTRRVLEEGPLPRELELVVVDRATSSELGSVPARPRRALFGPKDAVRWSATLDVAALLAALPARAATSGAAGRTLVDVRVRTVGDAAPSAAPDAPVAGAVAGSQPLVTDLALTTGLDVQAHGRRADVYATRNGNLALRVV